MPINLETVFIAIIALIIQSILIERIVTNAITKTTNEIIKKLDKLTEQHEQQSQDHDKPE